MSLGRHHKCLAVDLQRESWRLHTSIAYVSSKVICRGRFVQVGLSPLCQGEETMNQHWIQNLLHTKLSLPVLFHVQAVCMPTVFLIVYLGNKFEGSNTEKDIWYESLFLFNKVTHLVCDWHVSTIRLEDSKPSTTQTFGHVHVAENS